MAVFKIARLLLSFFKTRVKSFEREYYFFKKERTIAINHSKNEYLANILLVKNVKYVKVAKICVLSFLYFHPYSRVLIHVDKQTRGATTEVFSRQIRAEKVAIRLIENEHLSWQDQKIELALGMFKQQEFYMDADLRWNGTLPKLKGLTFFVEEFTFAHRSPYAQMLKSEQLSHFHKSTMKNTSFIYWGRYKISERERLEIISIEKTVRQIIDTEVIPMDDKDTVLRLREQIVLSLFAELISARVFFLKEIDSLRDGAFLESSYFGATGSEFEFK